jgi:hypothetical protein
MVANRAGRGLRLGGLALGAWLAIGSASVRAQGTAAVPGPGFYEAPGYYGTSYGIPSYGSVRTYSEFSSSYGAGYARGYAPTSIGSGRFGAELWRGSAAVMNPLDGASLHSYRTFAVPYRRYPAVIAPPFGVYAPAFGPNHPYPPAAYFGR